MQPFKTIIVDIINCHGDGLKHKLREKKQDVQLFMYCVKCIFQWTKSKINPEGKLNT